MQAKLSGRDFSTEAEHDVPAQVQRSADDDEQVLATPDAELLQAAAWELSSDGDSDGNEHQQAGHTRATRAGVSKSVLSAVTHGSRPPRLGRSSLSLRHPVSGPDAPPAARFASPGPRVAATDAPRHVCFLGRRDERSLWPTIIHSQKRERPMFLFTSFGDVGETTLGLQGGLLHA